MKSVKSLGVFLFLIALTTLVLTPQSINAGPGICAAPSAKAADIKPKIGDWINREDIVGAVQTKSPLMMKVLTHLQQVSAEDLSCESQTGKVYDRETKEISRLSINTTSDGVTTVRIYTRSLDQEDMLSVHPNGMWVLMRSANTLKPEPGPITRLAAGEANSDAPPQP